MEVKSNEIRYCTRDPRQCSKARKRKGILVRKEEIKMSTCTESIIFLMQKAVYQKMGEGNYVNVIKDKDCWKCYRLKDTKKDMTSKFNTCSQIKS